MPVPERELIAQIRRHARNTRAVLRGIGDDCAVLRLPRGHESLVTTDFSLETVHFRRDWHPAETVGHRCLVRGLSDIAAMGGNPIAAFLSLALPAEHDSRWTDGFLRGLLRTARRYGVSLAGGDTAQSPGGILADIVVVGSVPRGKAVLRSGARVGDDIFVTGQLGGASAVLRTLMSGNLAPVEPVTHQEKESRRELPEGAAADVEAAARQRRAVVAEGMGRKLERAHYLPTPRLAVGGWLRERQLVSAMIDISDGLSTDLSHICEESGKGAWLAEVALPVTAGATLKDAMDGGDDYELLFTAPAARHDRIPDRIAGVPVRWIGTITKEPGLWLVAPGLKTRRQLQPGGWEHFREP